MSECFLSGLSNEDSVKLGIQHIIADFISKHKGVMKEIRRL